MAERLTSKRDHSEELKVPEADETEPDHCGTSQASKRIRVVEECEGLPLADSTGILDKDVICTRWSVGEDNQDSLLPSTSQPDLQVEEKNLCTCSTSGNQELSGARTLSLESNATCSPTLTSDCQTVNQGDSNHGPSEAVTSTSALGDKSVSPCSGFDEGGTEMVKNRTTESDGGKPSFTDYLNKDCAATQQSPGSDGYSQYLRETSCLRDIAGDTDGQGRADGSASEVLTDAATPREPLQGLREVDVGIVEYISKHKGFHGVIKQRYQDFLVNEVDLEGKIVRLTDVSSPDPKPKVTINADEVLSAHDQQRLRELVETTDKKAFHCIEVYDYDKAKRKTVHELIRQDYGTLESATLDSDGKKVIKVTKVTRGGRKQRSSWDKNRADFCRFVMHKENMEVNDALTIIGKYLHVKHQSFGFSGTKDKRAITVQEVTAYRVEAERLSRLNGILRGIQLGNFRYVKDALTLGDHSGNHFVIVLRDINGSQEEIGEALTSMRDVGFINYFGMQRFGNSQVATHLVGRAVLHSNWQEAVDLILKPREGNSQDNRWRELWMATRDAQAVMDILPRHKTISVEMQLLKALKESQNSYCLSLQCIPRNIRLLYVHSYQSYVWNLMTTRRIQKYGLKVIPGDLVLNENKPDSDSEHLQPLVVDTSQLDAYSIQDVVLPLPGYAIQYPQNEVGDWYRELLHSDGLDIKSMRHQVKDFSLSGAYRKMVVKPDNVSWSVVPYSDVTIPLVQSDLDRLEGKELPAMKSDGHLRALRLEFTLSSSCYATMAIREVLKIDTSAAYQAGLNPAPLIESSPPLGDYVPEVDT